jgi:hypothetical protein
MFAKRLAEAVVFKNSLHLAAAIRRQNIKIMEPYAQAPWN